MIERDYLMRLIQQLNTVLARIMRAKQQEKYDEAQETIKEAHGELFGLDSALVGMMSAESLAQLLGDGEKIKAMARLFKEEGDLFELQEDGRQAGGKYQRSLELYLEVMNASSIQDGESIEVMRVLVEKVGIDNLSERYRSILIKMNR